jgi:hypothetical protein
LSGAKSPLTFKIEVPAIYKKADYTLYFSLNGEDPGPEHFDREVTRKRKFTYSAGSFVNNFDEKDILYMGVFSEAGCSFEMQVTKAIGIQKTSKQDSVKMAILSG